MPNWNSDKSPDPRDATIATQRDEIARLRAAIVDVVEWAPFRAIASLDYIKALRALASPEPQKGER